VVSPDPDGRGDDVRCRRAGDSGVSISAASVARAAGVPAAGVGYPAGNVTAAAVRATVELTTCDPGTHSCTSSHLGSSGGDSGGSTVISHLEFTQLESRLVACKVIRTSDTTSTIRNDAHHFMIQYSLANVPVSATCGTRLFRVRVSVTHVSGNPVKIDGTRPGGTEPESYTNAFVISHPDLRLVPDLGGDTLTAASQHLQAAGLVLGSHGFVATDEKSMNGLVLSQAVSPGTQTLAGSVVGISLGHYKPLTCGPHPC
jgi:PASTA domain